MTITSQLNRISFACNGVTTVFPITYSFAAAEDLIVLEVLLTTGAQTVKTLNSDYTITGTIDSAGHYPNGGNVVATIAPPGTVSWVVFRDPVPTQKVSLTEGGALPVKASIEFPLDYLTMIEQRTRDLIARGLVQPDGDTVNITRLPTKVTRASSFLAFDANGNPISAPGTSSTLTPVSAFMLTMLDDVDAPTARATIGAAPLASPAFTGTPSMPTGATGVTQVTGDNDTSLATTGFTQQEISAAAVTNPRIPVRQTVLTGKVDANGAANWLKNGTGLQIDYDATLTPVVLAMANGYNASGEVDTLVVISADATNKFGTLLASTTSFLFADYLSASTITGAATIIPPQYGEVYDQTQNVLLHFDGSNGATVTTDDYGNTWTFIGNGKLDTAQKQFGSASAILDGTGDYVDWTPTLPARFAQQGVGWTIEGWIRFNVLPISTEHMRIWNTGQSATNFGMLLSLFNNAGTIKLELSLSSNGTSADIVSLQVGTNTTWAINTWYHVAVTYDPIAGKYYCYFNGVQDQSVTSTLQIAQALKVRLGGAIDGTAKDFNGWQDEVRISPCVRYPNGNTFTPSASAFTVGGHFFSIPQMKMYEVTAASGAAGTDPSFTSRATRLFVGDCDAAGAAITTTRSYAYRGRYASLDTLIPAGATRTAFIANLGVRPLVEPEIFMRCYTAEANFRPGDIMRFIVTVTAALSIPAHVFIEDRNILSFVTGSNAPVTSVVNRTTGAAVSVTSTNFKMFVTSQRGW